MMFKNFFMKRLLKAIIKDHKAGYRCQKHIRYDTKKSEKIANNILQITKKQVLQAQNLKKIEQAAFRDKIKDDETKLRDKMNEYKKTINKQLGL